MTPGEVRWTRFDGQPQPDPEDPDAETDEGADGEDPLG